MSNDVIFWGVIAVVVGWYFFMMTFRTNDFINLMKGHNEHRAAQREHNAKMASTGAKIAGVIAKLFTR